MVAEHHRCDHPVTRFAIAAAALELTRADDHRTFEADCTAERTSEAVVLETPRSPAVV
jgi:hypothetical protein